MTLIIFVLTMILGMSPLFVSAEVLVFVEESLFLQELESLGYSAVHEGFEDDAVWGDARSTVVGGSNAAPNVSNFGLTWTSNNSASEITTSQGGAWTGNWGLYSLPHGSYANPEPGTDCSMPGECGDGLRARADTGVLYAIGGWFHTNTPFAALGMYLGEYPDNSVDLGETCDANGENCVGNGLLGTQWRFLGIVDAAGFGRVEFRELEGTAEDTKLIFADDFHVAGSDLGTLGNSSSWQLY